jgi:hypothetical protein
MGQMTGAKYAQKNMQTLGYKPHFGNLNLTGLESSSAGTESNYDQFNTVKVNQKREQYNDSKSNSNAWDEDVEIKPPSKATKKRLKAES